MRSIAHLRLGNPTPAAFNLVLAACSHATSVVEPADNEVSLDLSAPGCKGIWRVLWHEVQQHDNGASMGLATSRLVARIASEVAQARLNSVARTAPYAPVPDPAYPGVCAVLPGREAAFLAPLPVESLWLAEPRTLERLRRLGFTQVGQVASVSAGVLHQRFGHTGALLQHWANGLDPTPVQPLYPPKQLSHGVSCIEQPLENHNALEAAVATAAAAVAQELAGTHQGCSRLALQLIDSSGHMHGRTHHTTSGSLTGARVSRAAIKLARQLCVQKPVAELTVTASHLSPVQPMQAALFASATRASLDDTPLLEETMATLRGLFGPSALRPAAALAPPRRELLMAALEQQWLG